MLQSHIKKVLIFCAIVAQFTTLSLQANPPSLGNAVVFRITAVSSLDSAIKNLKQHLKVRKFELTDVLCYWKTGKSVSFMVNVRNVEGLPKMTSAQWFAVSLYELESTGIIKVDSAAQVISGAEMGPNLIQDARQTEEPIEGKRKIPR